MCTLILVSMLIAVYCFAVTPQDIQDNQCTKDTCGFGQFFNCTCLPCPPGYFNSNGTHRDDACQQHSTASSDRCILVRNGTSKTNNEWHCPNTTTQAGPFVPTSTPTQVLSTQNGSLSSSQETYLLIFVSAISILVIGIVIGFVIKCSCRRRPNEQREQVQVLMMMSS